MLYERRGQELTEANCAARKLLLKKFSQFAADFIFFTDEKAVHCGCSSGRIVKISYGFTESKLI